MSSDRILALMCWSVLNGQCDVNDFDTSVIARIQVIRTNAGLNAEADL
ncbi:MAG: hypothetical protein H6937_03165 [Burkholderiales bacterium]|nr:hypothetical protein [Burkholderiales bacterium]MDR4518586.1 hypothetical protein [Nitrosomonas sp.]